MPHPYQSDLIDLSVLFVRETDKAWCVNAGGKTDVWVPKSRCELERGDRIDVLTLPERLAKEKGLI